MRAERAANLRSARTEVCWFANFCTRPLQPEGLEIVHQFFNAMYGLLRDFKGDQCRVGCVTTQPEPWYRIVIDIHAQRPPNTNFLLKRVHQG